MLYELRTYTTLPCRLPALNKRFAKHTIQLFEKHGMKSEIYWVLTDEPLKENTLIYVISHESREAADKNWKEFQADPDWIKARDESEADGKILAKPPERVFYDGNRIFTQEIGAARSKPSRSWRFRVNGVTRRGRARRARCSRAGPRGAPSKASSPTTARSVRDGAAGRPARRCRSTSDRGRLAGIPLARP